MIHQNSYIQQLVSSLADYDDSPRAMALGRSLAASREVEQKRQANLSLATAKRRDFFESSQSLKDKYDRTNFLSASPHPHTCGGGVDCEHVPSYLDYCSLSQTPVPHAKSSLYNRAQIYPSGELAIASCSLNPKSPPPKPKSGPRFTRGVSKRGAKQLRRAMNAYAAKATQWTMLTFTVKNSDDAIIKANFEKLLSWARKYMADVFDFYVWVAELQVRGMLHYHLIVPHRLPHDMWTRLKELWAHKYDMGFVKIERIRNAKSASAYIGKMAKYITKTANESDFMLEIVNSDGQAELVPWRVSKDGEIYERIEFRGRAYGLSAHARSLTLPILTFEIDWGVFPSLGLRGKSFFLDSAQNAERFLTSCLELEDVPLNF